MFLLIVLAVLAVAGIVSTFIVVPRGQFGPLSDREWSSSQHQTHLF